MAKNLTLNQAATVAAIRNYKHLHGHAPSITELARLCERSRGTILARLKSLERKKAIARTPRRHRALETIDKPPDLTGPANASTRRQR